MGAPVGDDERGRAHMLDMDIEPEFDESRRHGIDLQIAPDRCGTVRRPHGSHANGDSRLIVASPVGDAQTTVELAPGASLENQRIELQPRVNIRGQVIDPSTRSPIPDAEVRVPAPRAESMGLGQVEWEMTDAEGRFSMTVPRGELPLRIVPAGSDEGRTHEGLQAKIEIGGAAEQELEPCRDHLFAAAGATPSTVKVPSGSRLPSARSRTTTLVSEICAWMRKAPLTRQLTGIPSKAGTGGA